MSHAISFFHHLFVKINILMSIFFSMKSIFVNTYEKVFKNMIPILIYTNLFIKKNSKNICLVDK